MVLNDQDVDSGLGGVEGKRAGARKLLVREERVERHEDAGVVAVRVLGETRDVVHRVARGLAGAEGRAADVDGVGAVIDRGDAGVGVAGGGEKFKSGEGKRRVGHEEILGIVVERPRGRASGGLCMRGRASVTERDAGGLPVELGSGGARDGAGLDGEVLGELLVAAFLAKSAADMPLSVQ